MTQKYYVYPGCTMTDGARYAYDCALAAMEKLGFPLTEIADWQCCGGVYDPAEDAFARKLPALRALIAAQGATLVTVCSACHHVLKRTNAFWHESADFRRAAENYMGETYDGSTRVMHLSEVLLADVGLERIKSAVTHPLAGERLSAFYGCMALRPSKVMCAGDPESPMAYERILAALGAENALSPARGECCGGLLSAQDPASAQRLSRRITESAEKCGAQKIVTLCPLCRYSLLQSGTTLPVEYFTVPLAQALGVAK